MVRKIKFLVLFLISFLLCFLSIAKKSNIEVNLLRTLIPNSIQNSADIILSANKSSSVIRVVFEAKNEDELQKLEDNFLDQIDKNYFEFKKPDVSGLLNKYLTQPTNFLSDKTKLLIENKKYDEIYSNSINMLYAPGGIQLSQIDKDPYLLFDDFILSNQKISYKKSQIDDKFYDSILLKIKNKEGLSPDLCNKKIRELIKIKNNLKTESSKIYLAGTPVHSYYTSIKSVVSINVICILSTILIIFLTYLYFRNLKLLIPVALSIYFGMLSGFCATKLIFNDFQIITMVFSATLIGIGIDYSYHYFFSDKTKGFIKNLTFSFLTSIIPFILLYLTNIELLKQVAIFTIFGLFGIYLVVLFIYPEFDIKDTQKTVKLNDKIYRISLIVIIVLSILGTFRFHFNDSLSALYVPTGELKKAEILYSKISGDSLENAKIITVKGDDFKEIIKKEEEINKILRNQNVDYISISKILPSKSVQEENFKLVKDLYKNNLNNYSDILSSAQIKALKNSEFKPVEFNISDYPFLDDFILDKNSTMIFAFSKNNLNLNQNISVIDFKSDIENCMEKYRKLLILILPVAIIILYILLTILYNFKQAIRMLAPSILGIICSILLTTLIMGEINLFSIIAVFLVVGFTMDYSIFRGNRLNAKAEDAILVSVITTSCSFLLLSFCGFKLLSSISIILFFGIITSYITGKLLISKEN